MDPETPHVVCVLNPATGQMQVQAHNMTPLVAAKVLGAAVGVMLAHVTEAPPKPQLAVAKEMPNLHAIRAAANGST